ncbi:SRPBCC family protein [Sphingomonas tabacisoli]|uniref:SRPBCC family protein n=1 Tax=Sphingomonas tabacisoli TaxID=2249466 RepID=A0ABW4HZW5_9SPHN
MRLRVALISAVLPLLAQPAAAADYVVFRNDVVVDRPLDKTWARIGGYCAIADWLKVTCEQVSGSGDVGSVRKLNGSTMETMVACTAHSYTYWQTVGAMGATSYHGTLQADPVGKGKTRLTYTIFYDQSALASDAVRASERTRLATRFVQPLQEMKRLAERK